MSDEQRHQRDVQFKYRNADIVVHWEPRLCIHSGNCLRSLPQVFNVEVRPWVDIDASTADDIAEAIMSCPTGALHFERLDGGSQETELQAQETTISERPNGPLFVRGRIKLVGADGEVIREATRAALCRCGHSENKPFCDLSHRRVGFRTTQT
jgi:uncharacterized Fe-S cluster protein YjdI